MNDVKIKVVIFGTGWAFKNYIKNYRDEYEIIGITDWDFEKHGNMIKGIKVLNPYRLTEILYDKILICSTFVKEIREQLENRLCIKPEHTIEPEKYKIKYGKPFESQPTRDFAREVVDFLTLLLKKHKVTLYLDFGTLLGFVRDGDFIPWDDDIDFSIKENDSKKVLELLTDNQSLLPLSDKVDWHCIVKRSKEGDIRYISLFFENSDESELNLFEIGIRPRLVFMEYALSVTHHISAVPKIHFEKYDLLRLKGKEYFAPAEHKKYLQVQYGNWEVPEQIGFGFNFSPTIDKSQFYHLRVPLVDFSIF